MSTVNADCKRDSFCACVGVERFTDVRFNIITSLKVEAVTPEPGGAKQVKFACMFTTKLTRLKSGTFVKFVVRGQI